MEFEKTNAPAQLKTDLKYKERGLRAKCNFVYDTNTSSICWWCDFFNSNKRKCEKHHPLPEVNQTCPYIQSTGANQ